MNYTSILKLALFVFALYANASYAIFLLNPIHAGNLLLYSLTLIADVITILILGYTWLSCLYFEIYKGRYFSEIETLKSNGQHMQGTPTAVLVPVVNEPIQIIRKTLQGITSLDGNKNVYLLDDGRREDMRELSRSLNINYIRRINNAFNKSGNLTNALKYITEPFIAVFDADFIPKKNFLRETLPLFSDPSVGIVQTPQIYYNQDTFFSKAFRNFQSLFYNYIQPAKSLQQSAFCVGTNVVYRRASLDAIGGFPNVEHSEDVRTSLAMYEKKIRTLYLSQELAYGRSPENVIAFFNQQFRWAKGGLSMLIRKCTLFNSKLTIDQRLHFFFSNIFYLSGVTIFIYLVIPLLSIIFNTSSINSDFFNEWVISYALFFISNFLLYSLLARNNILYSVTLGLFCYVPYTKAITAALFNKSFTWKTTGANSSDVVTRLIAPFLPYLVTSGALFYMFVTGFLEFQMTLLLYVFWLAINTLFIINLIFQSYRSVLKRRTKSNSIQPQQITIPHMRVAQSI